MECFFLGSTTRDKGRDVRAFLESLLQVIRSGQEKLGSAKTFLSPAQPFTSQPQEV